MADLPLRISVIIPTRNRAESLARTLAALSRQQVGELDWEVVVVENDGSDHTPEVVAGFTDQLPVIHVREAQPGMNRALNRGLEVARGELLVKTDDDTEPAPDWLAELWAGAGRWPEVNIFGGRVEPEFPADTPDWIASPDFHYASTAFARYVPAADEGLTTRHPFGPNYAIRHRLMQQTRYDERIGPQGGLAYPMGGEAELFNRLKANGERFVYLPAAGVKHFIRPEQTDFDWLLTRAYNRGRGQGYLHWPRDAGPVIAGAPLKLWIKTLRAGARWRLSGRAQTPERFALGWKYQYRRGWLDQLRSGEQAKWVQAPSSAVESPGAQ